MRHGGVRRRALLAAPALLLAAGAKPVPAATPISRLDTPWWRERHASKLEELRAHPPELVFLGDSITENFEHTNIPPGQDFAAVWQHFYGDRHAINLGFKGDATAHLLWRITHGELDNIAPKAVVILIGANNLGHLHWSAEDTVQGIAAIVAEIRRRLPATKILLLGVLPSERTAWATQATLEINRALAAKYAAFPNVTYIDVGPIFLRNGTVDRALFYDPQLKPSEPPLHPTAAGMARIAAAIEPTLAGMLGDKARAA